MNDFHCHNAASSPTPATSVAEARAVADQHAAARGVLSAVVIGAVTWVALVAALRWLIS